MGPANPPVDLDAEPQDGFMADQAGSYHNIHVSKDGRTLHVAFVWSDTDYGKKGVKEQPLNPRYNRKMDRDARYNLYYIKVDLPSGKVFNYNGRELASPVNKKVADRECLIWDTEMQVVAVPASILVDENGLPCFLLAVSDETPYKCWFYFVRYQNGKWVKTAITRTPHNFNSCQLDRSDDGLFKAYLVTGEGENISDKEMDHYGWGDRVEKWISDSNGKNWKLSRDLTPVKGYKYQNIKLVSQSIGGSAKDIVLFYGWQDSNADGTAFLWHGCLLDSELWNR